ncbi:hypothetical protein SLEP1_g47554 [Rubroshorea leprosula]|uniref:Uncharacterized protein n=1 Tax=Rubroshorea leprosula TaxID=152421 RepID=A0AAV5LQV5_9ROSI|nr:hypothetical protein SLEP1_g47554 [Rubroshorea leprosula]
MAGPSPEPPSERPACFNAKINGSCKCHEYCSIFHACYMSHGQLYQGLTPLPFPLNSTAHYKTRTDWTQS